MDTLRIAHPARTCLFDWNDQVTEEQALSFATGVCVQQFMAALSEYVNERHDHTALYRNGSGEGAAIAFVLTDSVICNMLTQDGQTPTEVLILLREMALIRQWTKKQSSLLRSTLLPDIDNKIESGVTHALLFVGLARGVEGTSIPSKAQTIAA